MGDMNDEYAYLEQQLEVPSGRQVGDGANNGRHDRRDRDRERGDNRVRDARYDGREKDRSHRRDRERSLDRHDKRDRGGRDWEQPPREQHYEQGRDRRGDKYRRDDRMRGDRQANFDTRKKGRAGTPPEERAAKAQEKELRDMERATRTLFVSNVNLRADEKDVFKFFSQAGRVEDVKLIKDRNKKFKGIVYVEMSKLDEVFAALQLTGQLLLGQPVWVKSAEHERNMQWELDHARAAQQAAQQQQGTLEQPPTGVLPQPLAIGASALPPLLSTQLPGLPSATLPGLGMPGATGGMESAAALAASFVASIGGAAGAAGPAAGPDAGGAPQDLDDVEEMRGGLKLTAASRQALMNRLATSAGLQTAPAAAAKPAAAAGPVVAPEVALQQGRLGPGSPIPTQYLLLKNMFVPEEEAVNGPGWENEIATDVVEEVSKYGSVLHCHVDPDSQGHIYLKLASVDNAAAAQRCLHGRWFAGRQIAAEFQFAHAYTQVFAV
eukprot:CAMPEP_0202891702 /NCGR_PEP_ID=MMETSP1392-20130828/1696_1 /ASSEMBLY_ACC=CAM_ASM_000868 /TAXON_ID=225041 /ORGANISM="Chlamydomonas chlamydogama, Strain SAG 11-48b" /LENGTH=493 /DNA_ID=CAMNT_0049575531 /DNA_START=40 /DNA_END=1521 /DNA_ORIENTATION=+